MQIYLSRDSHRWLTSVFSQIIVLLSVPEPEPTDPAANLAAGFQIPSLDLSDPAIERLFPEAVINDAEAAAEFRRYTMEDQRRAKIADAQTVLDSFVGEEYFEVKPDNFAAWIKTLTVARLIYAVRLGLDQPAATPPSSPERQAAESVYEILGLLLEQLLETGPDRLS